MIHTDKTMAGKKQPGYLLVLLLFLPLLAVNLSYRFLANIDYYWRVQEQQETANQELEGLAAGSEFSYQFARLAGDFAKGFKSGVEADLNGENLGHFLRERSASIFRKPFPEYELFAFHIPDNQQGEVLYLNSDLRLTRRLFVRTFEHLVNVNKRGVGASAFDKQNEKLLGRVLQNGARSDVLAVTQRGKASYAFYRYFPHWFLWDYFEVPGKGVFGYYLFCRNDESRNFAAKLLALRDLRTRTDSLGAFLPLYTGYGGAVLQSPLHRSRIFKNWRSRQLSLVENDLGSWLEEGTPPPTDLGNYKAFSYLGKGQTHLSVLLTRSIKEPVRPPWLFLTNLFFAGFLLLLLVRGIILGQWPELNIKVRFILTYLLVASLPISMLVITAYGYVSQFRRANHFQSVSRLQFCIRQFDARKAQIQEEYRSAFVAAVEDPELQRILEAHGSESEAARDRVLSFFEGRSEPLPVLSFALFDENGEGIRYYGKHGAAEADPAINAFKYPIVEVLRRKIRASDPDISFEPQKRSGIQATSMEAYKSMTGNDLMDEVDKRRSFPISRQLGSKTASQIHEMIKINGRERFAIYLVWDDYALDETVFLNAVNYFGINNPEFIFLGFRQNPQGLATLVKPGRDADPEMIARARQLAEQASFRGSYVGSQYDNLSVVAMPSRKYDKTIIVGATRHYMLERAVGSRVAFFVAVFLFAVCIALFCAYLAARIILDPITGLGSALDNVAAGRLNIDIASSSGDELGRLCREFSIMTRGLRDRQTLATLISDQAVDAISRSTGGEGALSGEKFSGVALVSDIRNFTGLCEEHSPDVITELLNEHFAQMSRAISEQGGRIYKFIGDAIEAVFSEDPARTESAAERAFNAASLMLLRLKSINLARSRNRLFNYRVGIGLASGEMYSGTVGSLETRLDYAILGEPLKKAARLEALSIATPDFPLVIDGNIAEILSKKGLNFAPLGTSGVDTAYALAELGQISPVDEEQNVSSESAQDSVVEGRESLKVIQAGKGSGLSDLTSFIMGSILVIVIVAGIFFGRQIAEKARLGSEKLTATASNMRLIEQMKGESAPRVGFEANCFRLVSGIEEVLQSSRDRESEEVKNSILLKINGLDVEEGRPNKFAVFLYDDSTVGSLSANLKNNLVFDGWSQAEISVLKQEAELVRRLDFEEWDYPLANTARPALQKIFGNQITEVALHREFFGKATEIFPDSGSEYFFWDYLIIDDESASSTLPEYSADHRQATGRRVIGIVLFAAKVESVRDSVKLLLNSYQTPGISLAVNDMTGKMSFSDNMPGDLRTVAAVSRYFSDNDEYLVSQDSLSVAGRDLQLLVFNRLGSWRSGYYLVWDLLLIITGLVLLKFWYETARGRTSMTRSLSAKLWLLLLMSAVIPLVTVFFVFGLFMNEDYSVRISQARAQMQRATDLFELRESFVEPLAWKFVRENARSKEIAMAARALNKDKSEESLARLKEVINSWYTMHEAFDPTVVNFLPRDIGIAGSAGWEYAISGKNQVAVNDFGNLLKQIARSIVSSRRQETHDTGIDTAAIEGEMVINIGLQTVRSLFGDDVFVKLSNGVGLPVLMNVVSGTAGLVIHAVPGVANPEFVLLWLVHFEYENYLYRIAQRYRGEYMFWPVETHRYGRILKENNQPNRHEMLKSASWISSANLPVSGRIKHNGKWHLLEGRPGISQMTSLLMILASEHPVDAVMRRNRLVFAMIMVFLLALILLIAKNVAGDILSPVRNLIIGMQQVGRENFSYRIASNRGDELGILCNSFDMMIKGLEEKMLMGRMLSKSAQKYSLQESEASGSKADFAFLYIGIPSFESWMSTSSAESMFSDLRSQVAFISKIVIEEGGDVDKVIGEKILAVFHVETDYAKAVALACRAAINIGLAEARGQLPFPVAVGINFGTVITGFLGVGDKRDFTVIGDAVNVTARIESLAETLRYQRCLASEKVLEYLPADIVAREYGEVELKGKARPMKVYQLTPAGNGLNHF
jgi:class 3 adenylate cyclase